MTIHGHEFRLALEKCILDYNPNFIRDDDIYWEDQQFKQLQINFYDFTNFHFYVSYFVMKIFQREEEVFQEQNEDMNYVMLSKVKSANRDIQSKKINRK